MLGDFMLETDEAGEFKSMKDPSTYESKLKSVEVSFAARVRTAQFIAMFSFDTIAMLLELDPSQRALWSDCGLLSDAIFQLIRTLAMQLRHLRCSVLHRTQAPMDAVTASFFVRVQKMSGKLSALWIDLLSLMLLDCDGNAAAFGREAVDDSLLEIAHYNSALSNMSLEVSFG